MADYRSHQTKYEEPRIRSRYASYFPHRPAAVGQYSHTGGLKVGNLGMVLGEVAEWSKALACKGRYALKSVSEVRILPLSAILS